MQDYGKQYIWMYNINAKARRKKRSVKGSIAVETERSRIDNTVRRSSDA